MSSNTNLTNHSISYYVCSYGGCGSTMICDFLKKYSQEVYHIHDRYPPKDLTTPIWERFGKEKKRGKSIVIYLYAYPEHSLLSWSAFGELHWKNIMVKKENIPLISSDRNAEIESEQDFIGYEDFFNNYVYGKRNYDTICIDYHRIWDNLPAIFSALEIEPDFIGEFPKKKLKSFDKKYVAQKKFYNLRLKMESLPPIFINQSILIKNELNE